MIVCCTGSTGNKAESHLTFGTWLFCATHNHGACSYSRAELVCACTLICMCDAHCLHSSSLTALLLQGQEVLKGEVATLLQRSLAAEQLAADRLAALTTKEQEVTHLHQSLRHANTTLADALEVKSLPVP